MIRSLIRCQRQSNHVGARGMKKIAELRRWQAPLWGAILVGCVKRRYARQRILPKETEAGDADDD
jgi:hypothetical protein